MKNNIIQLVLKHNFINNFSNVTNDIQNLTMDQMIKGFIAFKNAYNDLPNIFDCGDVESVIYFINK